MKRKRVPDPFSLFYCFVIFVFHSILILYDIKHNFVVRSVVLLENYHRRIFLPKKANLPRADNVFAHK